MKKLGTLMAAAMILAGTATFAATPAHTAKTATTKTATSTAHKAMTLKAETVSAKQEKPKATTAPQAKKAHKKHHVKKAAK